MIFGINAVHAALSAGRRRVERIFVERGRHGGRVAQLQSLARSKGVPLELVDEKQIQRLAGEHTRAAHQGVLASVSAMPYTDPEDLLAGCPPDAVLLLADGVEDPRNLGALIRTAAAAGAAGVIIPERRAAGLSPLAAKAASGGLEVVPIARVGNMASFVKRLKELSFWTVALDAEAEKPWDALDYPDRLALVVGGESDGVRRLVRQTCDEAVRIPLSRGMESLNLSVAAGVCLFEALRQRRVRRAGPEGAGGR